MKGIGFFATKAALSIYLLYLLSQKIDVQEVLGRLSSADRLGLLAALLAFCLVTIAVGVRWVVVIVALGDKLRLGQSVVLCWIGNFFNQLLPSSVGGDAVRAWLLSRSGIPLGKAFASVVVDRIIGMASLSLLIVFTSPFLSSYISSPTVRTSLIGFGLAGIAGFVLVLVLSKLLLDWQVSRNWAKAVIAALSSLWHFAINYRYFAVSVVVCLVTNLFLISGVYLLARAMHIDISFILCLILVPPVTIAATLPISIAGWGVREGAMVAGFGFAGLPASSALTLSLAIGVVQIVANLPGGVLWLVSRSAAPGDRPLAPLPDIA
jgi:uncharacterized protein (TIRG00374 family)